MPCQTSDITGFGAIMPVTGFGFLTKNLGKVKKNPNPQLTEKQKEENRDLSRLRIFVENAIGGMKKFNILNFVFRNKKENFGDNVIVLCAGLWNMAITT